MELIQTISKRELGHFYELDRLCTLTAILRCSQAFSFIPQVKMEELSVLQSIPSEYRGVHFDVADVRDTIMNGLKISYNPSIPIESYLDIVVERKKKIREIVNKIMAQEDINNENYFSDLRAELERVNAEVRSLNKSAKGQMVDLITNFAIQNKGSIVAGLVTAASMGLMGFGVVSCGAGIGSSLLTTVVSKKAEIKVPKEASLIGGKINTILEPYCESILAHSLSKDITAIQVWQLRKKLKSKD